MSISDLRGAAAITVDGAVVFETAETATTWYRLASVGKHICAAAILRAGLDLHVPASTWLPALDRRVTLHHLLSHTAGVGHWQPGVPGFDIDVTLPVAERLELIERAPLIAEPGSAWHYSSPGYALAGRILELATGQSYADHLNHEVFAVLGATAITAGEPPADRPIAEGHRDGRPVPTNDLTGLPGTRDVWATAAGLADFVTRLHTSDLQGVRDLAAGHVPMVTDEDGITTESYGYGLYAGTVDGRRAYLHPGDNPGFQTLSVWFPELRASIAILANEESTDPLPVLHALAARLPMPADRGYAA
ncbi:MAG: beta-lactamase family protein [Hamadaea sp.]|uniref:serine hydrolase domain-containing protein n=1 Tax=Hamadaea sp. TaxID=2024425 RepID=UPI00182BBA30|nr:serine hydrolase domain-containing protein [Hamadaea sp.]NUR71670.1 beta-lactamase family protein [Hamadaea sp.]NUT18162.1 beta-lactamase family protein [Hamadaea sp.]